VSANLWNRSWIEDIVVLRLMLRGLRDLSMLLVGNVPLTVNASDGTRSSWRTAMSLKGIESVAEDLMLK
jgi:hypothetical protein